MNTKIVSIDLGARSYDITIGRGLLYQFADLMPFDVSGRKFFLIYDENVQTYAHHVRDALTAGRAGAVELLSVPSGEASKSFTQYEATVSWALEHKITRDSTIVAIGGGVIGDLAGYCAATIMRGVQYVQVPTTILSQVDSSVGGKTGINIAHGKNLVGAFYQPVAVIADLDTLETLPKREVLSGYAEVLKYALIGDPGFFNWLEKNGKAFCDLGFDALSHAVEVSVKAKANVVQADERESGARMLLNLGHTFGHALEGVAGYDGRLLHGEAVAMGMMMAFDLSVAMDLCTPEDFMRIEGHMTDIGLLTRASFIQPTLDTTVDHLYALMQGDKKVIGNRLNLILCEGIGQAFVTDSAPENKIKDVLRQSIGGDVSGRGTQNLNDHKRKILKQWNSTQS